jgi:multiple sugar transport system ATP-binding protein
VFDETITAVDGISLDIEDGELVVFVGPSGSGKSTTLRMIAGLEKVSYGRILIGGEDVTGVDPQNRNIAMVFQSFALYPHRTVKGNISFPLEAQGVDDGTIESEVSRVAEVLGIEELLDRRPAELSGGQQQRVALGRALVRDPEVFLMDEPLANLDAKLRKEMRTELVRLQQQLGTTMIHVTHNQEEAMTMGDRVAVMNDGRIQQLAPPKELYNRPQNVFVADFIGSPSTNLLTGTLTDGRFEADVRDITIAVPDQLAAQAAHDEVTLGIRPEDLELVDSPDEYTITRTVEVVELLGNVQVVYLDTEGGEFLVEVGSELDIQEGAELHVRAPPDQIHLFDGVEPGSQRVDPGGQRVSAD